MATLSPSIEAKLKRIPKVAQEAAAKQIEIEAAKLVRQMKSYAPIDDGVLVESIGWTWGDAPEGSFKIATYRDNDYANLAVTIYAGGKTPSGGDAFYARFVEFGTAPGVRGERQAPRANDVGQNKDGRKTYRTHPGSRASPFFFLAYDELKDEMKRNIKQAVRDAIREM